MKYNPGDVLTIKLSEEFNGGSYNTNVFYVDNAAYAVSIIKYEPVLRVGDHVQKLTDAADYTIIAINNDSAWLRKNYKETYETCLLDQLRLVV